MTISISHIKDIEREKAKAEREKGLFQSVSDWRYFSKFSDKGGRTVFQEDRTETK